ncbi:MAG: DMT family transporter [Candidatus Delongbacteria bacterium]|jgi:drug/metabolite transporter (DMT)-like permease|nr:DMT family transporter [Candidatus Delongbacteria bacterium]
MKFPFKIKNKTVIYISLIAAMLIWAGSFIWSKQALEHYNPVNIVLFRLLISSLFLLPYLLFSKRIQKIDIKDMGLIFLMAFCEPFIYFMGETYGIKLVSAPVAAVIVSTLPLFTPLAAAIFLKDKLTVFNVLGVAVSFAGIILIVLGPNADFIISPIGLMFLFSSVFAGVVYSLLIKKISKKYSILNLVLYQNIIGIFLFIPVFLVLDYRDFMTTGFVWYSMWPIIKLAIFASSIAYFLYTYALKNMDISKVNVFANIIPVFTIIFSWIFLGELIPERKILGIIIIITGVSVSQISRDKYGTYGYIHRHIVTKFKGAGNKRRK